MGGDLEQTTPQTPPPSGGSKKGDTIIQQPPGTPPATASAPAVATPKPPSEAIPTPAHQSLRYHINGPEVHFHDDANRLKASIPVADWYAIQRNVQSMHVCHFVDPRYSTLLVFTPYVEGDTVECYAELKPVKIGRMMAGISSLKR